MLRGASLSQCCAPNERREKALRFPSNRTEDIRLIISLLFENREEFRLLINDGHYRWCYVCTLGAVDLLHLQCRDVAFRFYFWSEFEGHTNCEYEYGKILHLLP